jgi:hypothetical protein
MNLRFASLILLVLLVFLCRGQQGQWASELTVCCGVAHLA